MNGSGKTEPRNLTVLGLPEQILSYLWLQGISTVAELSQRKDEIGLKPEWLKRVNSALNGKARYIWRGSPYFCSLPEGGRDCKACVRHSKYPCGWNEVEIERRLALVNSEDGLERKPDGTRGLVMR